MKLHLVGGFLGSGKTTAIIQAARRLMQEGNKVGVVTNDQGKYLVDSAFFRIEELPTVEVTGGCFCCNYDDLNARIDQLVLAAQPDVVFAESVGSCADLVATVVKPLLELRLDGVEPNSFSVYADARLLLRRLRDDPMPFSEDVVYIFDKQMEEAGLLVVNKNDLLSESMRDELQKLLVANYPGKPYLLQSSLSVEGVAGWLDVVGRGAIPVPRMVLEIDYERYAAGEAQMGWVDEAITLSVDPGSGRKTVVRLLSDIIGSIRRHGWGIGHLKFIIEGHKVSFTTLEQTGWEEQIPEIPGDEVHLLVNARVEARAEVVAEAFGEILSKSGVQYELQPYAAFQPAPPRPTYRME